MPNIIVTIPNVTQSIDRPVVMDIANQVKEILKIQPDAETFFFSDEGVASTPGSTLSDTDRNARFSSQRMVMLEVERTVNIDNLATMVTDREEHIPVFEDKRLGVVIRPIYNSTDIRLNFKYRTTSKEEAKRWYEDIAIRVNKLRDMFVHSISYHYNLPSQAWDLISEVYGKREAVAGYNDRYEDYVQSKTQARLTLVGEGTGQFKLPVVPERQSRIIGLFDFVPLPEKPAKEEETGTYLITFTYKFTFDSVVAVNMVYPIMVHNQYLDHKWIEFAGRLPSPATVPRVYSESFYAFRQMEPEKELLAVVPDEPYIQIPSFDNFTPRMMHTGTGTVMLILMQILDDTDPVLFNLNDMGDAELHTEMLRFLAEGEWYYATQLYKSIFHVSIYADGVLYNPERLKVTPELNVQITRNLDLRSIYHTRISIVTDLTLLDPAALERLRKYPKLFTLYFSALDAMLRTRADFQRLSDTTRITQTQVKLISRILVGLGPMSEWTNLTKAGSLFQDIPWSAVQDWYQLRRKVKTVMTSGIIAMRKPPRN